VFIVGEGAERILAHRAVISIASPVFKSMFYGGYREGSGGQVEIRVPDIEPPVFRRLMFFAYTRHPVIDGESVCETLYAAKKYELEGLVAGCREWLEDNLDTDTAFMILTQSSLLQESELAEKTRMFVLEHADAVLGDDSFVEIPETLLRDILGDDRLLVSSEVCGGIFGI
jgi:hypothetical protein